MRLSARLVSLSLVTLLLGGGATSPAFGATAARLVPVAGGVEVLIDTDTQLDVVTVGLRAANGCSDCTFAFDSQRLVDRGLQAADFLDPGAQGRVGLERIGSFAAAPLPDEGVDFFTVQATSLLGGLDGTREGPLNAPGETTFRIGTLQTASAVQLVPDAELVPVVGSLLIGAFPSVPDRDGDGVGNVADNCLFLPNPGQSDGDGNGIGDPCQCGDVDGDGLVNTVDALRIARGQVSASDPGLDRCDVNGDGACNVADALMIARGEVSPSDQLDQTCPAALPPASP